MKKHRILISALVIAAILLPLRAFAKEEKVTSLNVSLIHPQKSNAPKKALSVSNEPVIVSGKVPVVIPVTPDPKGVEEERYLVEYFIDNVLVYSTNGIVENKDKPGFDWILDTRMYRNGKHKMIVNYWDSDAPSAIGIKYFIVENPLSIEDLRNE